MPKVYNKHHGDAPAGAVYIGRGSRWGNPFRIGEHGTRDEVIAKFEGLMTEGNKALVRRHLKGKDLVCFCAPQRCHGDILLRIANEDIP